MGCSRACLLLAFAVCGSETNTEDRADAEPYVHAFCESLCEKNGECDNAPYDDDEYCTTICLESQFLKLDEDTCVEQLLEYGRCRFDRLSCTEVFDDIDDDMPGDVCYELGVAWHACVPGDQVR